MRVVGLGALCDLDSTADSDPSQQSFRVSEFVVLDNGERVILHEDRGYSGRNSAGDFWAHTTAEQIIDDVLTVVLPDSDDSSADTIDDHPWQWLAELARAHGLEVTEDDLRQVPYQVVLSEPVARRLAAGG